MQQSPLELDAVVSSLKSTVRRKVEERNALEQKLHQYDRELQKVYEKIEQFTSEKLSKSNGTPRKKPKAADRKKYSVDTSRGIVPLTISRYRVLKLLVDNGPMQYTELLHELRRRYKQKIPYNSLRTNLYALKKLGLVRHTARSTWDAVG